MIGVEQQLLRVEQNSLDVYAVLRLLAAIGSFAMFKVLGCRRRRRRRRRRHRRRHRRRRRLKSKKD
jgi:hypothetical protein